MKFYSDFPARRARQIATDIIAVIAISAWVWLGTFVYGLVMNLSGFGVRMQDAGAGFRQTMADIEANLSGVPLIGPGISSPFTGASDAGAALEQAGIDQQAAVQSLATGLGIGIAVLPVLMILIVWLVPRVRFARRAGRARALVAGGSSLDLLALRALAGQNIARLTAIDPDPVAAWRRGDAAVVASLAALELRASGVRID